MSDPYFDYKNKVVYDYEFKVIQPIKLESENHSNSRDIPEQQMIDVTDNIMKGIESLIVDEDYNKESFEELGLGRVYPGVNQVSDTEIEMYFGISLQDKEQNVDIKILEDDIKEYMNVLDSNVDYDSSVSGWESYGDTPADDEIVDSDFISFKCNGKPQIEILKQPTKENIEFDKKLVNEGKIIFNNYSKNIKQVVTLNDDGVVEVFKESKWVSSQPFTKTGINTICKNILNEGYILKESEIETANGQTIDTEEEKEKLQKAKEDVEEIVQIKKDIDNELEDVLTESNKYNEFDKELNDLISKNATDQELNDFLEKVSYSDDITNNEYTKLLYKAQNTRKIESKEAEKYVIKNTKTGKYLAKNQTKFSYVYTNNKENAKVFDNYTDCYDYINKESSFGNNGAENWEEELLNESKETDTHFPSTEYTKKPLTVEELKGLDCEKDLTEEQITWLSNHNLSIAEFEESLRQLSNYINFNTDKPILSIDDYVNYLILEGGIQ